MSASPTIVSFDYAALPAELADDAREIASRINNRQKGSILATGRDLIGMKDRLEHGQFGAWLVAEFNMTRRSAERYMAAAQFHDSKCDSVSHLLSTTLYALAAPSLPEPARIALIERAKAGERLLPKDVAFEASTARDKEAELARLAKVKPKTKKARDAANAKRKLEQQREFARDAAHRAAEADLVVLIANAVRDKRGEALALLARMGFYNLKDALKDALLAQEARQ